MELSIEHCLELNSKSNTVITLCLDAKSTPDAAEKMPTVAAKIRKTCIGKQPDAATLEKIDKDGVD